MVPLKAILVPSTDLLLNRPGQQVAAEAINELLREIPQNGRCEISEHCRRSEESAAFVEATETLLVVPEWAAIIQGLKLHPTQYGPFIDVLISTDPASLQALPATLMSRLLSSLSDKPSSDEVISNTRLIAYGYLAYISRFEGEPNENLVKACLVLSLLILLPDLQPMLGLGNVEVSS